MEYDIKELPAVRLAGLRYKGPFGPGIGEFWREVFTPWQKAYNLLDRPTYGVALDYPSVDRVRDALFSGIGGERMRWAFAAIIEGIAAVRTPA